MKKWIILLIAAMAMEAQADDFVYKYLVVTQLDGNTVALPTDGLTLTLSNGMITATAADGTTTAIDPATAVSMAFAEQAENTTTAIERPETAESATGIEAYNLAGVRLGTFASRADMKGALGTGVFIIRQNGQTKKIILK